MKSTMKWIGLFFVWILLAQILRADPPAETWYDADIGTVGVAGGSSYNQSTDVFTIYGAGSQVGGSADSFHYLYHPATGNLEISGHVASLQNIDPSATAGFILRESTASNAVSAYVAVSPSNGIMFTTRSSTGTTSATVAGPSLAAPVWLRLVRNGGQITTSTASFTVEAYYSTDGANWISIGNKTMTMSNHIAVGMAVCSRTTSAATTATFDTVNELFNIPQKGTGLLVWLRADAGIINNGSYVSQWADQSGNGYNAVPFNSAPIYVGNALNGLPVVRFGTNSSGMSIANNAGLNSSQVSIFAVAKKTVSNTYSRIVERYSGSADGYVLNCSSTNTVYMQINGGVGNANGGIFSIGSYSLMAGIYNQTNIKTYLNGALGGIGTCSQAIAGNTAPLLIGIDKSNYSFGGDIAELLIYNRGISDAERQDSESYFYQKYGVGTQLTAATPVPSLPAGTYLGAQTITLSGPEGGTIYYTTDGSAPSINSATYTSALTISSDTTLKAFGFKSGYLSSSTFTATYTISSGATAPTSSLPAGTYVGTQTVTLSGQPGASIYYTTDGSTPTISSTLYTGPITIGSSMTLSAIAVLGSYSSNITTSAYTIIPFSTNGLVVWLKADVGVSTNAGAVTQWVDQSGNGNNAIQTTSSRRPTYIANALNGCPAIQFSSANLTGLSIAHNSTLNSTLASVITVVKKTGSGSYDRMVIKYSGNGSDGYNLAFAPGGVLHWMVGVSADGGSFPSGSYSIAVGTHNAQLARAYVNGALTATATYAAGITQNSAPVMIGNDVADGAPLDGIIAEVLVFNRGINDSERQDIEAYLSLKYGISALPKTGVPTISLPTGIYPGTQTVTLSGVANSTIYYTTDGTTPTTASTAYTTPLTVSTATTIKAVSIKSGYPLSDIASSTVTVDSYSSYVGRNGMQIWLRSDVGIATNSGAVSNWADQSGNRNDAVQLTSTKQPVYTANSLNGWPVLQFSNSANRYLQIPNTAALNCTQASVIIVAKKNTNSGTDYQVLLDKRVNANAYSLQFNASTSGASTYNPFFYINATSLAQGSLTAGNYGVIEGIYNQVQNKIYVNGVLGGSAAYTAAINTNSTGPVTIGGLTSGYSLDGSIAEVLLYNRPLSDGERQDIEAYLYLRYGIGTQPPIAAPAFSSPTGTYPNAQTVSISGLLGSAIYYTTDGSAPTISSATYTGPIAVTASATLKAISVKNGYQNSPIATSVITIDPNAINIPRNGMITWLRADVGVMSASSAVTSWADQSGNGFLATQTISSKQPSLVNGVLNGYPTIRFNNTSKSALAIPSVTALNPSQISVIAVAKKTTSGTYGRIVYKSTGNLDGYIFNYTSANLLQFVTSLAGTTGGAVNIGGFQVLEGLYDSTSIKTYLDGVLGATSVYSSGITSNVSPLVIGSDPSDTYPLNGDIAEVLIYNRGLTDSERLDVAAYLYQKYQVGATPAATAAPSIITPSGTYVGGQFITINAPASAKVYYTTDGSTPTTSSTLYNGPFLINSSAAVKAIAVKTNYPASTVVTANYTVTFGTASPTSDVSSGTYMGSHVVTLTGSPGSVIYYTTDGSVPTTSSQTYTAPITINSSTTIKSIAVLNGVLSDVTTANYTIVSAPGTATFSATGLIVWLKADAGITTTNGTLVSQWNDQSGNNNHALSTISKPAYISNAVNGLPVIRFNGGGTTGLYIPNTAALNPSQISILSVAKKTSSNVLARLVSKYSGNGTSDGYGINFTGSNLIQMVVNGGASVANSGAYSIGSYAVLAGTYNQVQVKSYLNGTAGNGVSYGSPIGASSEVLYIGRDIGGAAFLDGDIAELLIYNRGISDNERQDAEAYFYQKYGVGTPPPTLVPIASPAAGTYTSSQTVSLSGPSGSTIFYTVDGGTPTINSLVYTAPITISSSTTLKVIAVKNSYAPSTIVTNTYTIDNTTALVNRSGLLVWLRADSGVTTTNGTAVSAWTDQSGNNNNASQPVTTKRPIYMANALNGLPVVRFNVANATALSIANNTNLNPTSGVSIIAVGRKTTSGTFGRIAIKNSGSNDGYALNFNSANAIQMGVTGGSASSGALTPGNFGVLEGIYNLSQMKACLNGVPGSGVTYSAAIAPNTNALLIGSDILDAYPLDGDIAEVLIYNRGINDTERQDIEAYLYQKYGVGTQPTVAAPLISIPTGTYTDSQTISLTAPTGATLYYTTDGSAPTASSTSYSGPITLTQSATLKVIAVKSGYISSPVAVSTIGITSSAAPSGNDNQGGVSGKFSASPSTGLGMINPYTGNATRVVNDLSIAATGEIGLNWTRIYNTRNDGYSQYLGSVGSSWRHSFQWDLATTSTVRNGFTVPALQVIYPDGTINLFTETSTNNWTSTSMVTDVITPEGTGYQLKRSNNQAYHFTNISAGVYRLDTVTDSQNRTTTLTYTSSRLTQITEPGGHTLTVNYSNNFPSDGSGTPATSYYFISSVVSSDGQSVTYGYAYDQASASPYNRYYYLNSATYSGTPTTSASYIYDWDPSTVHILKEATDTRAAGIAHIEYTYFANGTIGSVQSAINAETDTTVAVVALLNADTTKPQVYYTDGSGYDFTVDAGGVLSNVLNSLNASNSYAYTSSGGTWTYSVTNALSIPLTCTYTTDGKLLTRTWPKTGIETTDPVETWTYNSAGYLATYTDTNNHTTTFSRNITSNLVERIDYPDGTYESFAYTALNQVQTHTLSSGGIQQFTYFTSGTLSGCLQTSQTATQDATHRGAYTYDSHYRVETVTDANGHTTTFEYFDNNKLKTVTYHDGTHKDYTYDTNGNLLSVTNELGKSWTYTYDTLNRVLTATDPLSRTTTYWYDPSTPGNKSPSLVTLPGGKQIAATYIAGWGYQTYQVTTGYYSAEAATTTYGYDAAGNVIGVMDPREKITWIEYDARNRKSKATDAAGNQSTFTYDKASNLLTQVTPDGTTTNVYDAMNRLVQSTDPKGQIATLTYSAGLLQQYADPNNKIYTYAYDADGRQTRLTYPDSSFEEYDYDWVGNMATFTNRRGNVQTFAYDNVNRNTGYTWNDGLTPAVSKYYDAASRLTSISSTVSTLSYTYDDANQLRTETQAIAGLAAKTTTYSYNVNGTLDTLTYPDATALTYGYDARNNVTAITQSSTLVASYTYDAYGNRTGKTLANGVTSTLTYDDVERLTSITDLTPSPTAGTPLQKFEYGYDTMSRRKYVRRDGALGDVYTYDVSGQITGVQYDATNPHTATPTNPLRTVSYALDAAGNRTGATGVADSVNGNKSYTVATDGSNRYSAVGGNPLTYDTNGSLATYNGWNYAYDAENRLIATTYSGTVCTFAYDPAGRQVKRVENGTTTYLLHDVSWSLLADYNGAGTLTARYVHGAGTDELLTKTDGSGNVLYYHTDGLGSVTKLTNSTGAVVEQYKYDIYGTVTIRDGSGTLLFGSNQNNRFLFTGREWIASIALYDYRNRVYSPELGRFLQPDPIGHLGDAYNVYRYCGNDPVNYADPSGLAGSDFSWGGGYGDGYGVPYYGGGNGSSSSGSNGGAADYNVGFSWWESLLNWWYPGRADAQSSMNVARNLMGDNYVNSSKGAALDPTGWMFRQVHFYGGNADDVVYRFAQGREYLSNEALIGQWKGDLAMAVAPMMSVERLALKGGTHIALGSRIGGLRNFATKIGAEHLLDAPEHAWKNAFFSQVRNPAAKFSLSTNGFFGRTTKEMILNEIGTGSNTGWELQQLLNAGRLNQVDIYVKGVLVPNPF